MGAMSYLLLTKLKNQLKSLVRSPGKLIYVIFILALMIFTIWSGSADDSGGEQAQLRDIRELIAGAMAVYTLLFVLTARTGFGNGASLFSMADVNLVFPAPINPRNVLFYGLFQQMGTSMLLGLFVLFQFAWMHNVYGLEFDGLLLIFAGCVASAFLGQITAMVIYAFTSADDRKRRVTKFAFTAVLCVFLLSALVSALGNLSDPITALVETVNTPLFRLLPVSGWLGSLLTGVFTSSPMDAGLGMILCVCLLALLVSLVIIRKLDYYEDVLKSTETAHSAITAKKEGKIGEAAPRNVKIGKIGLDKGWGADAFYYKHLIENRRSSIFIMDTATLIFALCVVLFSVFMRQIGIAAVFGFATYMQIFSISLGRINKELLRPFIYLVPEPPLKKMLCCLRESLSKYVLEAVIIFVPVSLILGLSPLEAIACILARISFAALFSAGNMLVERIWGGGGSKALVLLLYMLIMILLALPGLLLALLFGLVFPIPFLGVNETVFLSLLIGNIPVSLLAFYCSRNMLQYAELNYR